LTSFANSAASSGLILGPRMFIGHTPSREVPEKIKLHKLSDRPTP
jgi:hypothetical protein